MDDWRRKRKLASCFEAAFWFCVATIVCGVSAVLIIMSVM